MVPMPAQTAPRVVTWALILLGCAEIPWVVYLAFEQHPITRGYHLSLTVVGLGAASIVLCLMAGWAIWHGLRWAVPASLAAATVLAFTAVVGALSPQPGANALLQDGIGPLLLAMPSIAAAAFAASVLLFPARAGRPTASLRAAAAVLAITALPILLRTATQVTQGEASVEYTHARALVVLLDLGETVGLIGAGVASLRGHTRRTLVLATIAGALLCCDAWTNVVATTGQAFQAALVFLIIAEIPSIVVCAIAARAAHLRLREFTPSQ